MSNKFLGQILMAGFDFAPRNFGLCNGQLLAINQNQALFSLLGTTYGGNGQTNFALPDLRGRTPVGFASGFDPIGQRGGVENVTLTSAQIPSHAHVVNATTAPGNNRIPSARLFATSVSSVGNAVNVYAPATGASVTLAPQSVGASGGNQPHPNMQPYSVINFCIALAGVFPSRF